MDEDRVCDRPRKKATSAAVAAALSAVLTPQGALQVLALESPKPPVMHIVLKREVMQQVRALSSTFHVALIVNIPTVRPAAPALYLDHIWFRLKGSWAEGFCVVLTAPDLLRADCAQGRRTHPASRGQTGSKITILDLNARLEPKIAQRCRWMWVGRFPDCSRECPSRRHALPRSQDTSQRHCEGAAADAAMTCGCNHPRMPEPVCCHTVGRGRFGVMWK